MTIFKFGPIYIYNVTGYSQDVNYNRPQYKVVNIAHPYDNSQR